MDGRDENRKIGDERGETNGNVLKVKKVKIMKLVKNTEGYGIGMDRAAGT